ncbi:MAG: PilX N-terminal domain-containing pilus assembly protein [Pseudomonadota bacterium]
MSPHRQRGTTLVVGMMLLAVVTLLGLAGAASAQLEQRLAQNDQFRENAASAASAGIEYAISAIVTSREPQSVSTNASATLPGVSERFETVTRFVGHEESLPQQTGAHLAAAHFEITSTGWSQRTVDRQRARVMLVVPATNIVTTPECAPAAVGVPCHLAGELVRLSWQRLPR